MKTLRMVTLAAVLLGRVDAAAAEEHGGRAVTLREALAAAGQAPRRVAAESRAHAAGEAVRSAGGLPPTTIWAGSSRLQARLVAGVQVPVPVFGRLRAARDVARAEHAVASADAARTGLELRRDVMVAWYELAHSQAGAGLAAKLAAQMARLAEVAHRRFDAGDVPWQDAVQADAAAARAATEAGGEALRVGAASATLAALLGWDPVEALRAAGGLPESFPEAPPLAALVDGLDAHPEIAVTDAEVEAASARVVAASRERWPQVSLSGETEAFDSSLPGADVRVTLNLDVPLLGRRLAARDTAAAERAAMEAERATVLTRARGAVVAAWRQYDAARGQTAAFAGVVVPAAKEAARLAEVAYQQAQGGLMPVLQAQRSLGEVQKEWLDSQLAAATALAELERASGGPW